MATIFSATEPDEGPDEGPPGAVDLDKIERGVRLILEGVGEDTSRAASSVQTTSRAVVGVPSCQRASVRNRNVSVRPCSDQCQERAR